MAERNMNRVYNVDTSKLKRLPAGYYVDLYGTIRSSSNIFAESTTYDVNEEGFASFGTNLPDVVATANPYFDTYYEKSKDGTYIPYFYHKKTGNFYSPKVVRSVRYFNPKELTEEARKYLREKYAYYTPDNKQQKYPTISGEDILTEEEQDNVFNLGISFDDHRALVEVQKIRSGMPDRFEVPVYDFNKLNTLKNTPTIFSNIDEFKRNGGETIIYNIDDAEKEGFKILQGLRILNGEDVSTLFPNLPNDYVSASLYKSLMNDYVSAAETYIRMGGNTNTKDVYDIGRWYLTNKDRPVKVHPYSGFENITHGYVPLSLTQQVPKLIYNSGGDEIPREMNVYVPATQLAANLMDTYTDNHQYELNKKYSTYQRTDPADNFLNWGMAFPKFTAISTIGNYIGDELVDWLQRTFGNNLGNIIYNGLTGLGVHPSLAGLAYPEYWLGYAGAGGGINFLKRLGKNSYTSSLNILTPSYNILRPVMSPGTLNVLSNIWNSPRGTAVKWGLGIGTANAAAQNLDNGEGGTEVIDIAVPIVTGLAAKGASNYLSNKYAPNPKVTIQVPQSNSKGKNSKPNYVTGTTTELAGRSAFKGWDPTAANMSLKAVGSPYRLFNNDGIVEVTTTKWSKVKPYLYGLGTGAVAYGLMNGVPWSTSKDTFTITPSGVLNDSSILFNPDTTIVNPDTSTINSLTKVIPTTDSVGINTLVSPTTNSSSKVQNNTTTKKDSTTNKPSTPPTSPEPNTTDIEFEDW